MSNDIETFAQDLLETLMMNAVDFSITQIKQDDDNDNKEKNSSPHVPSTLFLQDSENKTLNISHILQQVAQLAESLREDLQNIQIGDYVVSMNASPLEIQVKEAIGSVQILEDDTVNKIINTKGEGDGEHQDLITDDETTERIPMNKYNSKDSSDAQTSSPLSNAISPLNTASDSQKEIEQELTENLKQEKHRTLGERIRRIFRFTFNRRRNS